MMRTLALLATVAGLLPAQITTDDLIPRTGDLMPQVFPHEGAQIIRRDPVITTITITATHQPRASLRAAGVDDKTLALYEVSACSPAPRKISTARIRAELARRNLQIVAPHLGIATAEVKRGRLRGLADLARDLAPGGTIASAFAGADSWITGGVSAASLLLRVFVPPHAADVVLAGKDHLESGPDCDSDIMLARWPSRGRGPEVVTVEIAQ